MTPKIIVISGPTASGKTALGVALCQKLGGEVVSADVGNSVALSVPADCTFR